MSTELQGIFQKIYDPSNNALRVSGAGDAIWLTPRDFVEVAAGPSLVVTNGAPRWALDGTNTEGIISSFIFPALWVAYNISVFWVNDGAGAGGVAFQCQMKELADGDNITEAVLLNNTVTPAALAQNIVETTQLNGATVTGAAVDRVMALRIDRLPANAADTLANDASILGVQVKRAI